MVCSYLQAALNVRDADEVLVGHVGAGHGELEVAAAEQVGADVLQLQRRQLRQLAADAPEHVVVQVPRLVQVAHQTRLLWSVCIYFCVGSL